MQESHKKLKIQYFLRMPVGSLGVCRERLDFGRQSHKKLKIDLGGNPWCRMVLEHTEKVGNADLNGSSHNVKDSNADLCGNPWCKMLLERKEKVGNADLNGSSHNLKVSNADLCGNLWCRMVLEHTESYHGTEKCWQRRPKWKLPIATWLSN